jgi:hypothetical protein
LCLRLYDDSDLHLLSPYGCLWIVTFFSATTVFSGSGASFRTKILSGPVSSGVPRLVEEWYLRRWLKDPDLTIYFPK